MKHLARLLKDESGVTAIEYGLIAAATGLALVAAMPPIKAGLTTLFGEVAGGLPRNKTARPSPRPAQAGRRLSSIKTLDLIERSVRIPLHDE